MTTMLEAVWAALADPWAEPVLRRAFLEVALLGVAGGALGCWVVLYGLAYSAESLAHALLPGLVLAALAGAPLVLGAAAGLLVAALAVAGAARLPGVERDTAVAVVVSALFGLGIVLALAPDAPAGLGGLLFGDVLGLTDTDLLLAAGLVALVLGGLAVAHPRLLAVAFDRSAAAGLGIRAGGVDAALLVLVAAALLVAVQGLGNLLVVAVLVAPAATARLVTRRMAPMLVTAAGIAVATGVAGLYLSYHAGAAAGASIAATMVATFAVTAAVAGRPQGVPAL